MRRVVENIECCRMILQLDIKIDVAIIFIRCIEKQFSPTREIRIIHNQTACSQPFECDLDPRPRVIITSTKRIKRISFSYPHCVTCSRVFMFPFYKILTPFDWRVNISDAHRRRF